MHRFLRIVVSLAAMLFARAAWAQSHDWLPTPSTVDMLVVASHPDDEGLFFGGLLPYYSQTLDKKVLLISMTSGDGGRDARDVPPEEKVSGEALAALREQELAEAAWRYGLRYQPVYGRFYDGGGNSDWAADPRDPAEWLAEQIARYKPLVVVAHDQLGEYGHQDHRATGRTAAAAWDLLTGSASQPQKLYLNAHGDRLPFVGDDWLVNRFIHDSFGDDPDTVDHPGVDRLYDLGDGQPVWTTALEAANHGVRAHLSQGGIVENYIAGNRYSEDWWLYRSTVGRDDYVSDLDPLGNLVAGADFFQNTGPRRLYGDFDGDGVLGRGDWDVLNSRLFSESPDVTIDQGDLNGDLRVDERDFLIFKSLYSRTNPASSVAAASDLVPEPSTAVLTVAALVTVISRRPRRRRFSRRCRIHQHRRLRI